MTQGQNVSITLDFTADVAQLQALSDLQPRTITLTNAMDAITKVIHAKAVIQRGLLEASMPPGTSEVGAVIQKAAQA